MNIPSNSQPPPTYLAGPAWVKCLFFTPKLFKYGLDFHICALVQ